MAKEVGRSRALSPFRRLVTDLMIFSRQIPAVTVERRFNLQALAAARRRCTPRPAWAVVFAKAFALVARTHPELRRAYMAFPRARLYEHPYSTAAINVERQVGDEAIVVQCVVRRPDNRPLAELDDIVRFHQSEPVQNLPWYRRATAMSRVPWPLRLPLWWAALNVLARRRTHTFGTFSMSTVGAHGAGLLHVIPLLTSLHYGLFDKADHLDVRLTWDHRVMDGAAAARILVALERTLQGEILNELAGTVPMAA